MENFKQMISLIVRMVLEIKISQSSSFFPRAFVWFLGWGDFCGLGFRCFFFFFFLAVVEIMNTIPNHSNPELQKERIHM